MNRTIKQRKGGGEDICFSLLKQPTPSSDCFPNMRISFPNQSAKGHAFQRHQMEIAFLMLFSIALYGSEDHRHSNSGPPFFLIWSLPRLWYGSWSGSISLNHLSIFYNISCYNSLVLTFVSRYICIYK